MTYEKIPLENKGLTLLFSLVQTHGRASLYHHKSFILKDLHQKISEKFSKIFKFPNF